METRFLRLPCMKKVAVFGNAGGGKSTLSKRLSEITGLPLYVLDKIKNPKGDAEVPHEDYKCAHQQILATDRWIIQQQASSNYSLTLKCVRGEMDAAPHANLQRGGEC